MPLDSQAQAILDRRVAAGVKPYSMLSVGEARQLHIQLHTAGVVRPPVARVENRQISGPGGRVPVRIYNPQGSGPFPVLVYFHGGGWVLGNLETHDAVCRQLTNAADCIVVAVDYRRAPEHKFPAAAEDAYAATRWVEGNAAAMGGDRACMAVGGDSAGGNLAAVVALMARDRGGPRLGFQLLVYPVTDFSFDTPSYHENAVGYALTRDVMVWFWNHYLANDVDGLSPYASPLRAPDLRGLPPALVITAEFDPLRDEGEAYAVRLHEAGVPVACTRYDGMIHGFFLWGSITDQGRKAVEEAAAGLRSAFARQRH